MMVKIPTRDSLGPLPGRQRRLKMVTPIFSAAGLGVPRSMRSGCNRSAQQDYGSLVISVRALVSPLAAHFQSYKENPGLGTRGLQSVEWPLGSISPATETIAETDPNG